MKQEIVSIGKDADWLTARRMVADRGGLPSNVAHDDTLVYSGFWEALKKIGYYGAWAREVVVYPGPDGVFVKGQDVVDAVTDWKGRYWKLHAKDVPKEAIGKIGAVLVVDPGASIENAEETDNEVIIHPVKVTVKFGFPQRGGWNKVDKETRLPLAASQSELAELPNNSKRYLWRRDCVTVRPLARGYGGGVLRRVVGCDGRPDWALGVGFVKGSKPEFKQLSVRTVTFNTIA